MNNVKGQIEQRLRAALNPEVLEVEDFSAEHRGHASAPEGGESHFRVRIQSEALASKSRVERQRAVYAPLKDLMPAPIHALEIIWL